MENKRTQEQRCIDIFIAWLKSRNHAMEAYDNRGAEFPDFYLVPKKRKRAAVEIVRLCDSDEAERDSYCDKLCKQVKNVKGHYFVDIIYHGQTSSEVLLKVKQAIWDAIAKGVEGRLYPIEDRELRIKKIERLFIDIAHYPFKGSSITCQLDRGSDTWGNNLESFAKQSLEKILREKGLRFKSLNSRPHILLIHDFYGMIEFKHLKQIMDKLPEETKTAFDYVGHVFNFAFTGMLYSKSDLGLLCLE